MLLINTFWDKTPLISYKDIWLLVNLILHLITIAEQNYFHESIVPLQWCVTRLTFTSWNFKISPLPFSIPGQKTFLPNEPLLPFNWMHVSPFSEIPTRLWYMQEDPMTFGGTCILLMHLLLSRSYKLSFQSSLILKLNILLNLLDKI